MDATNAQTSLYIPSLIRVFVACLPNQQIWLNISTNKEGKDQTMWMHGLS